jgi:hypothetical protein
METHFCCLGYKINLIVDLGSMLVHRLSFAAKSLLCKVIENLMGFVYLAKNENTENTKK